MNPLSFVAAFWTDGNLMAAFWATCGLLVLPVWAIAALWEYRKSRLRRDDQR